MKESGRGLIWGIIQEFTWRDWLNDENLRIVCFWAEIWDRDLQLLEMHRVITDVIEPKMEVITLIAFRN
jgi:hypothetical protein